MMNLALKSEKQIFSREILTGIKLSIELTTPIDDPRPIYIVGNFNNWRVDEERFRLKRIAQGRFSFHFPNDVALPEVLEYKYVRGGWDNQELDAFGNILQNRTVRNPNGILRDAVPRWKNYGLEFNPKYLPKKLIISDNFFSEELQNHRKITALLPYNYAYNLTRRYPVLYLHDGQNLFNEKSPFGNWEIDKKLAVLAEIGKGEIIVIAIDHTEKDRAEEFIVEPTRRFAQAKGRDYIRFVAQTVKPFIDTQLRTLTDRENTCLGGSSLGGLISIHAGLMYPEIFGKMMIFSPSFWVEQKIGFQNLPPIQNFPIKAYIYGGGEEGSNMLQNIEKFTNHIHNHGFDTSLLNIKTHLNPSGKHSEARWGEEFSAAVDWLFF